MENDPVGGSVSEIDLDQRVHFTSMRMRGGSSTKANLTESAYIPEIEGSGTRAIIRVDHLGACRCKTETIVAHRRRNLLFSTYDDL